MTLDLRRLILADSNCCFSLFFTGASRRASRVAQRIRRVAKRTTPKTPKARTGATAAGRRKTAAAASPKASAAKSGKTIGSGNKANRSKTAAARPKTKQAASTATRKKKVKKGAAAKAKKVTNAKRSVQAKAPKSVKKAPKRRTIETTPEKASVQPPDRTPTSGTVLPFPNQDKRIPKTRLTPKQLLEFRELLIQKRAELAGDVNHLSDDFVDRKGLGPNDHTSMPIHMADVGSDNWEKEFTLDLIENEHALIREIDEALVRVNDRTYGVCLATHKVISIARLRAKPWAKYCIEYARAREEGRAL